MRQSLFNLTGKKIIKTALKKGKENTTNPHNEYNAHTVFPSGCSGRIHTEHIGECTPENML
jgi:hypothetical protein